MRRIGLTLVLGCLAAAAAPAGAVDKDLEGFARVRFGMSIDEVRAARPDGEFRPELGEFWILKRVADPDAGTEMTASRIRVGFSRRGLVNRIVNENLLAERSRNYAECRAHFDAMLGRITAAVGEADRIAVEDEPRFLFGQLYRARNLATYRFNNGASLELRSTWSQRPILTRLISDHTCRLNADYYRP